MSTTGGVAAREHGERFELVEEGGPHHRLAGHAVADGALLELRTDTGWVSGHYRRVLHPETGGAAFEMHLSLDGGAHEHVTVYLPDTALLRWPGRRPPGL